MFQLTYTQNLSYTYMFQLTYTQKKILIKLYYYDTSLMKKTFIHLLHLIGSFQNSLLCKFSQTVPREVPDIIYAENKGTA